MNDYEISDQACPHCGHDETRTRDCDNLGCEGGWLDDYADDPTWFEPGDCSRCSECRGAGFYHWCPHCGRDPRKPVSAQQLLISEATA